MLIYDFLLNKALNDEGLSLSDMWVFSYRELEDRHDYIQWMFPTTEKSAFNPDAPIVEDIAVFENHPDKERIRSNIKKSFILMLGFYGLEMNGVVISKGVTWETRKKVWLHKRNHNHLRITRILKCLKLFSLDGEKDAFKYALSKIYKQNKENITKKTFDFWMAV